ncbi:hypothetical protein TVNIR_1941 [Thioalkalivibrio nitratireducens DSM 14787]|uniref:Uncharacterized protein n=1 Tax=Thioalkalivibrio nitratireducens (strain DSM 14787 / UNIQEM 213 / ALEN2) TaxID=1255043 RepID=L0DX24_THIND|nr:hypothetical protein TVNIR_1941 [Thioalkalivibrio nitratireducens DSM 14787]
MARKTQGRAQTIGRPGATLTTVTRLREHPRVLLPMGRRDANGERRSVNG